MANSTAKLNRAGRSHGGFLRIPYAIMAQKVMRNGKERKLTPTQRAAVSAVYSFSTEEKSADCKCRELAERYRMSESSAFRALKFARDGGLIERKEKVSEYEFRGDAGENGFLMVREWAYFAELDFEGKADYLTKNEVLVLSYIISQCRNQKGAGLWFASRRYIARRLNLSATTVSNAVERLKDARLIFASGKATNSHSRETFSLNKEALETARKAVVKRIKGQSEAVKEADAKAQTERVYAHRKAAAEDRAERMKAKARSDEGYRQAEKEIGELDVQIAKAEVRGLPSLPWLIEKQRAAQKWRADRLAAMGLTEEDLVPQYYCKKCSDSGFLPNGRACDCYPTRGQP